MLLRSSELAVEVLYAGGKPEEESGSYPRPPRIMKAGGLLCQLPIHSCHIPTPPSVFWGFGSKCHRNKLSHAQRIWEILVKTRLDFHTTTVYHNSIPQAQFSKMGGSEKHNSIMFSIAFQIPGSSLSSRKVLTGNLGNTRTQLYDVHEYCGYFEVCVSFNPKSISFYHYIFPHSRSSYYISGPVF